MNLLLLKKILQKNQEANLHIMLPSGEFVPSHFHVTEVGLSRKTFVDCGGTKRNTTSCVLQVWFAKDLDHRLSSTKLLKILDSAKSVLEEAVDDVPVEIEYGSDFISQYPLGDIEITPNGLLFVLVPKYTACLAPNKCGC